MAGTAGSEEWIAALMLAVAASEQIDLLANETEGPLREALSRAALQLRDLATTELERLVAGEGASPGAGDGPRAEERKPS